jgi:hypothetical protein
MKKFWLSVVVVFFGLLVWAYAAPISPFMVYLSEGDFIWEDSLVCTIFHEIAFVYSIDADQDKTLLKPLAHLCLRTQLRNIKNMDQEALETELSYLIEVYHLDLDTLDREVYREKHINHFEAQPLEDNDWVYVAPLSLSLSEEEIFNLLLWTVEKSRRMFISRYPDEYETCKDLITQETDPTSLSDQQWDCIRLSHKIHSKYTNKYKTSDEYGLVVD